MHNYLKHSLAITAVALAAQASAQVTFYQHENFKGQAFTSDKPVTNFQYYGFNDQASSVVVAGRRWEVCESASFKGRCTVLKPGQYPSLAAMGLGNRVSSVRVIGNNDYVDERRYAVPIVAAAPSAGQVVFYENESFQGRSFTAQGPVDDFSRYGFSNAASSVVVIGDRWEVCDNARFNGQCVVLRPGRYASLAAMGMNDRVSSVRSVAYDAPVADSRYAPLPVMPAYDNRRRQNEQLYQVNVSSVRAVVATPEQRCWMERAPVAQPAPQQNQPNIGGAIAGALIGGILGHQVGGGSGKDIATVGGLAAGAALGANIGRNNNPGQPVAGPDVQRCETQNTQARPEYWDVTYNFRGQEHRIQMTSQPGPTITVNGQGEPRA